MCHRATLTLGPAPVDAPVKRVGQLTQFTFFSCVCVEVGGRSYHTGHQEAGVNQRDFREPHPCSEFHIKEVEVETPVARCVCATRLVAVHKEA